MPTNREFHYEFYDPCLVFEGQEIIHSKISALEYRERQTLPNVFYLVTIKFQTLITIASLYSSHSKRFKTFIIAFL